MADCSFSKYSVKIKRSQSVLIKCEFLCLVGTGSLRMWPRSGNRSEPTTRPGSWRSCRGGRGRWRSWPRRRSKRGAAECNKPDLTAVLQLSRSADMDKDIILLN